MADGPTMASCSTLAQRGHHDPELDSIEMAGMGCLSEV